MGEKFDPVKYKRIIECCGIDFSKFRAGDQTEILKFGQNLSISERKYMLLARQLYLPGHIYILDGVFDHEEPEVDKHLYAKITNTILKDKTVMLRTDNDLILKQVDAIFVFDKDKIIQVESHKEYASKYNVQDKLIQKRIEAFRNHYDEDLKKAGINCDSVNRLENYLERYETTP